MGTSKGFDAEACGGTEGDQQLKLTAASRCAWSLGGAMLFFFRKKNFPLLIGNKHNQTATTMDVIDENCVPNALPKASRKRKAPEPKAKKVSLENRVKTLPHDQLVSVLVSFLKDTNQEEAFVNLLPAIDVTDLSKSLQAASAAIRKALPHSRYGSNTDSYGFKRARPG